MDREQHPPTSPQGSHGDRKSCSSVARCCVAGLPGTRLPGGDEPQPGSRTASLETPVLSPKPVWTACIWSHKAAHWSASRGGDDKTEPVQVSVLFCYIVFNLTVVPADSIHTNPKSFLSQNWDLYEPTSDRESFSPQRKLEAILPGDTSECLRMF